MINAQHQDLISMLTNSHNLLLTSLLCTEDPETWESCKHLIICSTPLLTLEMAINRITQKEIRCNAIPTPTQIYTALEYAQTKKSQYLKQLATLEALKAKELTHN